MTTNQVTTSTFTSRLTSRTVATTVVGLAALYALLPALWLLLASTKNSDALFSSDILSLGDFSLWRNLTDLFSMEEGIYGRWYVNSLLYAVVGALVGSLISVAAGYAFDKYEFPHKEKLFRTLEAQNRYYGSAAGFEAGELLISPSTLGTRDLMQVALSGEARRQATIE